MKQVMRVMLVACLLTLSTTMLPGQNKLVRDNPNLQPETMYLHLFEGEMIIRRSTYHQGECVNEFFYAHLVSAGDRDISGLLYEDTELCTRMRKEVEHANASGITVVMVARADKKLRKALKQADKAGEKFQIPPEYILFAGFKFGQPHELAGNQIYALAEELPSFNPL